MKSKIIIKIGIMKIKYQPVLCLSVFFVCCQLSFGQMSSKMAATISQFEKVLSTGIENDNLHGSVSAAILKDNQVIWAGAFGYANTETDKMADTGTIYRIGSITKTFTATILMQLVEEGKLKLDDAVETYLPEIKNIQGYAGSGKITFRQLASHTSGLKREPDMAGADVGPLEQWEDKLLACIPNTSFNSRPGREFLYSNIGYALLGLALSRAAGVPYIGMVQQRILTPLHMEDTFFTLPDDKRNRLAEGIDNNNEAINMKLPLREIAGRGYRVPNGGLYSTPGDLAKFVMAMMGKPPLLTAKSRMRMQDIPDGGRNYGLGLMIVTNQQLNVIGHNGSVPGYTSQFAIEQDSHYAVILMRNTNKGSISLETVSLNLLKQLKNL